MNEQSIFSTAEFLLAASLYYFGFSLEGIDKTNPKRSKFIFLRSPELDELTESYWKKTLIVEPISFWNATKSLKSRLYDGE